MDVDSESTVKEENGSKKESLGNGELKQEQKEEDDEDGEFDESDDDDDDNIQVHIGEVNTTTTGAYGTPVSWKKDAAGVAKSATLPTQGQKKIDVNTVGLINGQPIYEYDIDSEQDDKPWRKPGADISDYFNYGFTEDTWKQYCEKQRRMRMESNRGPYTVTTGLANPIAINNQVEIEVLPDGRTRVRAGPPPDRKVEGSIHVLGGSDDARRKQKEDELLALALGPRVITAPTFPGQRPLYTALPGGAVMYNPLTGQQMIQPPPTSSSQGETTASENSLVSSQGQQIQTLGAPTVMNSALPPGMQYLPPGGIGGMQQMGGPHIFPPPHNMGMDFPPQDPFLHPGMPPGFGGPYGHSDEDFDSDGENRRHRRRDQSRHRRHRDRSDREPRIDRDRDRERSSSSRRDRDRSESRSRRDHSKLSSERKKHSSRSSNIIKVEDGDNGDTSERKTRSSRRSSKQTKEAKEDDPSIVEMIAEIKKEPVGD